MATTSTTSTSHQAIDDDGTVWFEGASLESLLAEIDRHYETAASDEFAALDGDTIAICNDYNSHTHGAWTYRVLEVGEEEVEAL